MATEEDASALRRQWNPDTLGRYEGEWIAFRGKVRANHPRLDYLLEQFAGEIREGSGPIFAYVTFAVRA